MSDNRNFQKYEEMADNFKDKVPDYLVERYMEIYQTTEDKARQALANRFISEVVMGRKSIELATIVIETSLEFAKRYKMSTKGGMTSLFSNNLEEGD